MRVVKGGGASQLVFVGVSRTEDVGTLELARLANRVSG